MAAKHDAISMLKDDHREVEELFKRFEDATTSRQQQALASQIVAALRLHTQIEDEIFYPAVREAIEETELVDEAEVEHDSAKYLIEQIESGELSPDMFRAAVMVLGEYVQHHVEEEEKEMFPKAKKSKLDLVALGESMQALKTEQV
ncbi:MAG: hemerythrin domain-containing protein [Sphingomonadales bacterium]